MELEKLAEARTSIEEWLGAAELDTEKRCLLERSLAALGRCESLQVAMTTALVRDLVELVEEWARVSAERAGHAPDGGGQAAIKPALYATAAGFAERKTGICVVRSRDAVGDGTVMSDAV